MMRIGMRHSLGRFMLPLFVAVSVFTVVDRGTDWRYSWRWGLEMVAAGATLVLPLLAGTASADAVRRSRGTARELFEVEGTRGRLAVVAVGLTATLWAWIAVLIVTVGIAATVWTTQGPPPEPGRALVAVPYLLALGGIGCLAAGLGWWVPTALTPFLAAVGTFALIILAGPSGFNVLFELGGATAGEEVVVLAPDAGVLLLQAAFWVAVVAVVSAALLAGVRSQRRLVTHRALWLTAACCLGSALSLGLTSGVRFVPDDPTGWPCEGAPKVCLSPEYATTAAPTSAALRPLLGRLVRVDADAMSWTFYQSTSLNGADARGITIPVDHTAPDEESLAYDLARGVSGCSEEALFRSMDGYADHAKRVEVLRRWVLADPRASRAAAEVAAAWLRRCPL